MRFLLRHVLRSIFRIRMQVLIFTAICAATTGLIAGGYSAISSLFSTVTGIQQAARMADLELIVSADDEKNLPDFSQVEGVNWVDRRLLLQGQLEMAAPGRVAGLFVGARPGQLETVNRLRVLQGQLPAQGDAHGIALDRSCAAHHGSKLGQPLRFIVDQVRYEFIVRAIVESPEYLITPVNSTVYLPVRGSLCVMFGSAGLMQESLGFPAFNSLLFGFKPGMAVDPIRAAVRKQAQTRLSVDYALLRSEQFSQKFLELHLNTFRVFLPALVFIFAMAASLVVYFLMSQWVREERRLIAMLSVLGYSRVSLLLAYLVPGAALFVIGNLIGLLASFGSMWTFATAYADAVGMPTPVLTLDVQQVFIAMIVTAASVIVGVIVPMRSLLHISPIEALKDSPATTDTVTVDAQAHRRLPGPFWFQYTVRNLLRYRGLAALSVVTIGASLAVPIALYMCLTSIERTGLRSLDREPWIAVMDFEVPLWSDEVARMGPLPPGARLSGFLRSGAQLQTDKGLDNAFLIGIEPQDGVRRPTLVAGRMLTAQDTDAVVVERMLALKNQLEVGGEITLLAKGNAHRARVVGIESSPSPSEIIAPLAFTRKLLDMEEQQTGAFVIGPVGGTDVGPASLAPLTLLPRVSSMNTKQQISAAVIGLSDHIKVIIHLTAGMSALVAALFLLSSIQFSITSRQFEYGMLRIIGHEDSRLKVAMMAEAVILVTLGGLLAIPLGWSFGQFLNESLARVWFKVESLPALGDFLGTLVPALLLVPLAAWPAIQQFFRLPPIRTLKQRRFG